MIQEQAMLANLNIKSWTARKHDKAVSIEVDVAHSAVDGGRYNKMLINKAALDPIAKLTGRIRDYHYTMTLPWGDNGDRLLPAKMYLEYAAALRSFRTSNDTLVAEFVSKYPGLVTDARTRLGTMYDANDYPAVSDIKDRFGINVSFMPVPDAKDFRVDVGAEALEEIKASINKAVDERQASAINECWRRLYDVVFKLHAMMLKGKPVFRDSLFENISDLTAMIPNLNITNDLELTKVCALVDKTLFKPLTLIRKSASARAELAEKSAAVLNVISPHL
jgi:hypothetical protein